MDSVIFYQPRQIPVPAFRRKAIRSSAFRYPPITVSGRQSWVVEQRSEWDKTLKAHDVIGVADLTGLDQGQGPVLEQRAAGDNPARVQGNSTAVRDGCIRKGTDGAGGDDDDEEFPSIASVLSGTKRKGALVDDGGPEGDRAGAEKYFSELIDPLRFTPKAQTNGSSKSSFRSNSAILPDKATPPVGQKAVSGWMNGSLVRFRKWVNRNQQDDRLDLKKDE